MIRIGDSESPRHALSNDIALIRLYDKVKSPAPIPTWHPSSHDQPCLALVAIIIPTLDSETPGDRCMELCRATITARRRGVTSGPIIDQSQSYTAA